MIDVWQIVGTVGATVVAVAPVVYGVATKAMDNYMEGYAKKKGETLATKEDLEEISRQLEKTTRVAEETKAQVTDKSVAKQKNDEMKRAAALEIMRMFGTMQQAAVSFYDGMVAVNRLGNIVDPSEETRKEAREKYIAGNKQFQDGLTTLWQLEQVARVVFPTQVVHEKVGVLKRGFIGFRGGVTGDDRQFEPLLDAINLKQQDLADAIKAQLDI